jgi:hypothetical protein
MQSASQLPPIVATITAQQSWLLSQIQGVEKQLRGLARAGLPAHPPVAATHMLPQINTRPAAVSRLGTLARDVTPVRLSQPVDVHLAAVSPLEMFVSAVADASPLKGRDPMLLEDNIGDNHMRDDIQPTQLLMQFQAVTASMPPVAPPVVCGYTTKGGKVCQTPQGTCTVKSHKPKGVRIVKPAGAKRKRRAAPTGIWNADNQLFGVAPATSKPKLVIALHWNTTKDDGSVYKEELVQLAAVGVKITADASAVGGLDFQVCELEFMQLLDTSRPVLTFGLSDEVAMIMKDPTYESHTVVDALESFWDWVAGRSREHPDANLILAKHGAFTASSALMLAHDRAGLSFQALSKNVVAWIDTYSLSRSLPAFIRGVSLRSIASTLGMEVQGMSAPSMARVTVALLQHDDVRKCFGDPSTALGRLHGAHVAYITQSASVHTGLRDLPVRQTPCCRAQGGPFYPPLFLLFHTHHLRDLYDLSLTVSLSLSLTLSLSCSLTVPAVFLLSTVLPHPSLSPSLRRSQLRPCLHRLLKSSLC